MRPLTLFLVSLQSLALPVSPFLRAAPNTPPPPKFAPAPPPSAPPDPAAVTPEAPPAHALKRAGDLLLALSLAFEGPAWREATCRAVRKVFQAPGQIYGAKLPPVWFASVDSPGGVSGYLMWEDSPEQRLLDFALDAPVSPRPQAGQLLPDVPNLQQFPVPGTSAPKVASGCVPTAGANLLGFWARHGFGKLISGGASPTERLLEAATLRLRGRIPMREIADSDGFTDNGMPLSGAFPEELRAALEAEAATQGVSLNTSLETFTQNSVREEISAGRPILLTCLVRLPQKPHLSWGHQVTGSGWMEVSGEWFAGIRDNFLPSRSGETVRWLAERHFQTALRVHPRAESVSIQTR